MKHPVYERHHGYGAEWLQAVFTLVVLGSIYQYSLTFDPNTVKVSEKESKNQTSSYWNNVIWYWFRGDEWDKYHTSSWLAPDTVSVSAWTKDLNTDKDVRVSFYTNTSIETIEKNHTDIVNKTYSRLSNGIAVIEWDLSSSRAKNILATLHAR
jgi:hypothetical protein